MLRSMLSRKKISKNTGPGINDGVVRYGNFLTFVSDTPMSVTPVFTNPGVTIQYSFDSENWIDAVSNIKLPSSTIVYFRGQALITKSLFTSNTSSNRWLFDGDSNIRVLGNINMLIQDVLGGMVSDIPLDANAFSRMFYNCKSLVKTPDLPSTTLASYCYSGTFMGCSNLIETPVLPAMVLAHGAYTNMFRYCNSLVIPPELPATTLGVICYGLMFSSCTNLTMLPKLPAITLPESCYYNMFYGCSKIKLSATKTGAYVNVYRLPITGTGTMIAGAMEDMFYGSGGTFASTPTINKTYYTENTIV